MHYCQNQIHHSRLEEEEAKRQEKDQRVEVDEKEEEEMVTVVENGGQSDDEEEDFILREQVNSLKLQVTSMIQDLYSKDEICPPDPRFRFNY